MVEVANRVMNRTGKEVHPETSMKNPGTANAAPELKRLERDTKHGLLESLRSAMRTTEDNAEKSINASKFSNVALVSGIIGSSVGIAAAVTAAALSPWFNWSKYPLSAILSHPMGPLLASGVIGSGIATAIYSAFLYQTLKPRMENRIGAVLLATSGGGLAVLGLTTGTAHLIAASTFFIAAPLGISALGLSMIANKLKPEGIATIGLSTAAAAIIVVGHLVNDTLMAPFEIAEASLIGLWLMASTISISVIAGIKRRRAEERSSKNSNRLDGQ